MFWEAFQIRFPYRFFWTDSVQDSSSKLREWSKLLDSNWNGRIDDLIAQISTLHQVSSALGFQPTPSVAIETVVSPMDWAVDPFEPPVFSFSIFDAIFPCRKDDIIRRLHFVMHCFYRPNFVKLKEEFQNTLAVYARLDLDRLLEGRNGVSSETGKMDHLLSMDQIFSLSNSLNKLQTLRTQCLDMIKCVMEMIRIEKQEEHDFASKLAFFLFQIYLFIEMHRASFIVSTSSSWNHGFKRFSTWSIRKMNQC